MLIKIDETDVASNPSQYCVSYVSYSVMYLIYIK